MRKQTYSQVDVHGYCRVVLLGIRRVKQQRLSPPPVQAAQLSAKGIDAVVAVSPSEAGKLAAWTQQHGFKSDKFNVYADSNGGFVRLLGLDLSQGPKCQRFAGIVEDGILLKLVRQQPGCLSTMRVLVMADYRMHVDTCTASASIWHRAHNATVYGVWQHKLTLGKTREQSCLCLHWTAGASCCMPSFHFVQAPVVCRVVGCPSR